ncbi:class I SAM-dependent methyltransferase [Paracoccaceae bacterium]|nr:class I SAM-dependent methyltransferase [Paracoccaceae bacterium]
MVYRTKLPHTASVAVSQGDGRLFAPSAGRNSAPIVNLIKRIAPEPGNALEIASGTGQHIVQLALSLPNIIWSPSEVDAERLKSISAWVESENLLNIKPPIYLDATETGWAKSLPKSNFILLVNLLHLISWDETETLISELSIALKTKGIALVYGPFMRNGQLISEGDKNFHTSLIQTDPDIGYKNDLEMLTLFSNSGLLHLETVEMPSNNAAFVLQKAGQA